MKRIILLISIFLIILSCKSQKENLKGTELPAYEPNNNTEVLKSIINSSNYEKFQKLLVNDIEYPLKDLQKILDTLPTGYKMNIKNDSITNKRLLIIKSP